MSWPLFRSSLLLVAVAVAGLWLIMPKPSRVQMSEDHTAPEGPSEAIVPAGETGFRR